MSCLYMLAINPLSVIIICQNFLPFSRLSFNFVDGFFFFCYAMCTCQVSSVVSDSLQPCGLYIAHRCLSSVHRILQARILKWVAIPSSRGSSWPRDWTRVSCLLHWQVGSLPLAPPWKPLFFAMQKHLSLIRSHLLIFAFIFFALGDGSKNYCCDLCQWVFCLCFPQ